MGVQATPMTPRGKPGELTSAMIVYLKAIGHRAAAATA